MRLTYKDLENLLAELHDVGEESRVALQGRIKHFQRSGWPGGTNTGKGRAATYDFGAVIKLCLGFELLQLGVTPERATNLLRLNWDNSQTALSLAMNAHPGLSSSKSAQSGFDVFLYCDPRALALLSRAEYDPSDDTFFYTSAPELARGLTEKAEMDVRRLALINLTTLLDAIMHFVGSPQVLQTAYAEWEEAERASERLAYIAKFGAPPQHHRRPTSLKQLDVADEERKAGKE